MAIIIETPWGIGQTIEWTAVPGVDYISTASHGGYRLDAKRTYAMREGMPSAFGACIGAGIMKDDGGSWWEEDCAWAFVAIAFPEAFPPTAQEAARRTIKWLSESHPSIPASYYETAA